MQAAAFTPTSLPLHTRWLARSTPRRTRTSPCKPEHTCCLVPPQPSTTRVSQILAVEQRFRILGADAAADLAYVSLSTGTTTIDRESPKWPRLLDTLASYEVKGSVLSAVAERLGVPYLLRLEPLHVVAVLEYLSGHMDMTEMERNRVITRRPDVLASPEPVRKAVDALEATGLRLKDIKTVLQRWPGLLLLDARKITRVSSFLESRQVGFSQSQLRSLLRRAPWVLVYDTAAEMTPAIQCLRKILEIPIDAPVDHFIRAHPILLGTSPAAMQGVSDFMSDVIGLDPAMLSATMRSFPPLLTCSIETNLSPAVSFLMRDMSLQPEELKKVVRAFPAVLTLEVEGDMRPVVNYFRRKGIINVGRIIKRLPPVLGYDLSTNIIPKMEYIERELGLSSFDILKFPGYFSYSLDKCIEPRTKFLQAKGRSVTEPGLNRVLGLKDEDFCERIALVPTSQYFAFKKAFLSKRKTENVNDEPGEESDNYERTNKFTNEKAAEDSHSMSARLTTKRRRRRFRTTLSRMPWRELK